MPIKVKNISYTYEIGTPFAKTALQNLSLEIKDNSIVGIMGSTGSGKSTLLQILSGLLIPQRGQIDIDEFSISNQDKPLKPKTYDVGLVFQFPETQFVMDNVFAEIAYGLSYLDLSKTQIKARVVESMELVGLPFAIYQNAKLNKLSSGEKRRVAIATILALKTKYLLLDEPTVGLDYPGREVLKKVILQLTNYQTVVLVSHNLSFLLSICDEIYILSEGTIKSVLSKQSNLEDFDQLYMEKYQLPAHLEVLTKLNQRGWTINPHTRGTTEAIQEIIKNLNIS